MEPTHTAMPTEFDQLMADLHDLPDVVKTRPTIVRVVPPMGIGGTQIYAIQTMRQGEAYRVFFERVTNDRTDRIVIPPEVADVIARQREAASKQLRKRISRSVAADRKARGEKPGFMMSKAERAEAKRRRDAKGAK